MSKGTGGGEGRSRQGLSIEQQWIEIFGTRDYVYFNPLTGQYERQPIVFRDGVRLDRWGQPIIRSRVQIEQMRRQIQEWREKVKRERDAVRAVRRRERERKADWDRANKNYQRALKRDGQANAADYFKDYYAKWDK